MKSKKIIIGNWKMNPVSLDEARRLTASIEHRMHQFHGKADVAVCPPYVFLPALSQYLHFLKLGAQNSSWDERGALTGEVSPSQLAGFGVKYVILGHSERRINFGETNGAVMLRTVEALKHGLVPVLCLGGERNASKEGMKRLVLKQLKECLAGTSVEDWHKIIFVYEPSWAISTMKQAEPATPEHAAGMIAYMRALLKKKIGESGAAHAKILYGGSVNGKNASQFASMEGINGALVGAASLDGDDFTETIREFIRAEKN